MSQVTDFVFFMSPRPPKDVTEVVMFDGNSSMEKLVPLNYAAFFTFAANGPTMVPRLYIVRGESHEQREHAQHELAHRWVSVHLPKAPP